MEPGKADATKPLESYVHRNQTRQLPSRRSQEFRCLLFVMDTSPSLGLLTINALNAADYALIPVSCDFLSLVGLTLLFDTIRLCQEQLGSHVRILGLVAKRYDRREKVSAQVLNALKQRFNTLLFETVVRVNVRLKEAPSYRQSIYEYDPVCPGAKDHLALANELIKKIE